MHVSSLTKFLQDKITALRIKTSVLWTKIFPRKNLKTLTILCALERKAPSFLLYSRAIWVCNPDASSSDPAVLTPHQETGQCAQEELESCCTQGCNTSSFFPSPSFTFSTSICAMALLCLLSLINVVYKNVYVCRVNLFLWIHVLSHPQLLSGQL